jgi:hypothetical protein
VVDNPVRWGILGTGGMEVDGDFHAPAGEVAHRQAAGDPESPLMRLDGIISTMETVSTVPAQAWWNA